MTDNKKIEKIKRLSFNLPFDKHQEIKLAATSMGLSIKEFIENALYNYSEYLKKRGKNEN